MIFWWGGKATGAYLGAAERLGHQQNFVEEHKLGSDLMVPEPGRSRISAVSFRVLWDRHLPFKYF